MSIASIRRTVKAELQARNDGRVGFVQFPREGHRVKRLDLLHQLFVSSFSEWANFSFFFFNVLYGSSFTRQPIKAHFSLFSP